MPLPSTSLMMSTTAWSFSAVLTVRRTYRKRFGLISSAVPNRFIDSFYEIITVIFHYHYQWNKHDERVRNEAAIGEHLTYIDALLSRNVAMVELACRAHLASARDTLLRSTSKQQ